MGFAVLAAFMVGLFFGTGSGTVVIQKNIKQGHVIVDGALYVCTRA